MIKVGKMLPFIMGMLVKKPNTVKYPYEKVDMPDRFRGKLKYTAENCIGCKICTRVCPAGALEIEKIGEKQFKASVYLDRCIYCGQCVDSCPKKALENTKDFELASLNRESLKVDL